MDRKTVVALYDNRADARNAVEALNHAGFDRNNISLLANNAGNEEKFASQAETVTHSEHHDHDGAKKGAAAGGVLGGIAGLLIGLGTLVIPGIGPIVAAGPIATTLIGAGVGAAAGGLVGALMDIGVPEEDAHVYSEAVRRGSTLVALTTTSDRLDEATDILNRFDPVDVDRRAAGWRQEGWSRFEHTGTPMDRESIDREQTRLADEEKIPVVEEELVVGKRDRGANAVRVRSYTVEEPVEEQVNLRDEKVRVERRPVDRELSVDSAEAFQDRSIELTERSEEAVVGKRARVKEEVVVSKDVDHHTETVRENLRHTEVDVDRVDATQHRGNWQNHFQGSIRKTNERFDDYEPAYRFGHAYAGHQEYQNRSWDDVQADLQSHWGRRHGAGTWSRYEPAVRHGYTSNSMINR